MSENGIEFYGSLVIAACLAMGSCAYRDYSCSSRADRMSMKHSWGPVQGCMVQTKQGWRPIEAIRDIDP